MHNLSHMMLLLYANIFIFVQKLIDKISYQFMFKLKIFFRRILSKFSKVQLIIIAVLIIICFFISDSNLFARWGYDREISDLQKQIKYYRDKTETDKRKLEELQSDKNNIEKFARENYLMKKENEEVFILK